MFLATYLGTALLRLGQIIVLSLVPLLDLEYGRLFGGIFQGLLVRGAQAVPEY